MKGFLRVVVRCVLALAGFATVTMAQQSSGVSGVASDNSGGTISGVTVALDNPKLGLHATTTTSDSGYYQFLRIAPAAGFELTFTKDGFRKFVLSNVTLGVSTVETRNVTLELGSVTQSVEIQATGEATLNTTDATVGNVISTRSVSELPLQARLDAAGLMTLQAGVNGRGSITGARSDQGNITLDGLDLNDQATGQEFTSVTAVSLDALQEVRTITAGETADFGRSSGGMISLVTKGGTNEIHGNLREYHRNTVTTANDWFNNRDGVARPALIRNQFGGNLGGPIKKDKLFFFVDYEGLRLAQSFQYRRAVPTDQFRAGELGYINNTAGCDATARFNTEPQCITFLSSAQVASLDPIHAGPNAGLLTFVNGRYPEPNDFTLGDGINTAGFIFTAPAHETEDVVTARVDYNLSSNHRIFLRGSVDRDGVDDGGNAPIVQFPGDSGPVLRDSLNSYATAVGWNWTISSTANNQLSAGLTRQNWSFPSKVPSTFPNAFGFGGGLSNPFAGFSSQARNVPIPELRDGLTIFHGKHTMDFGGDIKWIRQISSLKNDFNFPVLGLGGNIQQLSPSLRPSDILQDPSAISIYDSSFPFLLGRYAEVAANFNYDKNGNVLAPGSGKNRSFNYNEYEVYAQDSWKLRSDLTLTYGLRYILHSVPYEVNGFQSVPSVNENAFLATRVNLAAQGVSGIDALPFVSYSLGGHANGKPGYYEPDHKDFEPRIGIAFNPSFSRGLMNAVFGDRKSTVRGGFSILHDRIGGGASFGLDQNTFLFDSNNSLFYGTANAPRTSLTNDPRFTDINTLPGVPSAPDVTAPSTPNVDSSGTPFGLAFNPFTQFFQFDRKTKNPYSMLINFGIQRELPGNFLFEADYVGRLGRRLLAVGDAAEVTNFKDSTSGQFLLPAFGALQKEVTTGSAITPQPWFENQMNAAIQAQVGPGFTCADFFGVNCTEVVGGFLTQLVQKGDVSDTIQQLAGASLLDFNVAMPAQTSANAYIGNYANSSYNAFLVILRKRVSNGLEFDLNYTYSHSIDNVSDVVNNYVQFGFSGSGLVCNLQNLRICRASSDFDARHYVKANFLYDLPFGKGRLLASSAPRALNYVIGGWTWSGIATYRTGYPFSIGTGSFPTAFSLDSPAVLVGGVSGLQPGIHTDAGGNLQYFKSVDNALSAVDFPQGGAIGNRNIVTGPGLFNFDMGVAKQFAMPWSDKQVLKFRWDSFNTFNHPSFSGPASASLSAQGSFGIITSTASAPRVMQFALRYEF